MSALLVAAFLLPLVIAAFVDIREARRQLVADAVDDLAARSEQIAREIDALNRGYQRGASVLSRSPTVLALLQASPEQFVAKAPYLKIVMEAFGLSDRDVRGTAIIDPAGIVRAASEPVLLGADVSYRPYVRQALRGQAVISDVFVARPDVGNAPTIAYASPVFDADHRTVGLAVIFVHATSLWRAFASGSTRLGPGSGASLMDSLGIRIAISPDRQEGVFHPSGPLDPATIDSLVAEHRFGARTRELVSEVKAFPEGFTRARAVTLDKTAFRARTQLTGNMLYSVARRPETVTWTVFYVVTEANIEARTATLTNERIAVVTACIALGLLAAAWLARSILGPIEALSRATAALAGGALSARVVVGRGGHGRVREDELAALGASFNAMAERLEAQATDLRTRHDELERRVEERTATLQETAHTLRGEIAERQHTESRLQAQVERLNLLDQITYAIGERQDLQSIYRVVIRSLEDQLPLDFCCVCRYDNPFDATVAANAGNTLTVTAVATRSLALATTLGLTEETVIGIDQDGLSACVRGELVHEPDLRRSPHPFPQRLLRAGLRSLVAAPLMAQRRVFGIVIAARRQEGSFTSGECEFLRQLSEHVGLAAQQAQLYATLHQTQEAAMQDDRLRALGQMASGIAHDINNAISPMSLYTEALLEQEPNLSPRAREYLTTIDRAIGDVGATVARMREFYRQREPQLALTPLRLNQLVPQVVDLTRARWSDMPQRRGIVVELKLDLMPDPPPASGVVLGVESEVREALINLIFNAVDSMPHGGTLTLRTRRGNAATSTAGEPTQSIQVDVVDTGVGMDEEARRRCLEPFFTTKGERGTGLGLAMVYGMAQRHRADLQIESEPGRGTTVSLRFPVTQAAVLVGLQKPSPEAQVPTGLRLLLVDDDPVLLKSLCDIFQAEGHDVTAAHGGQAGIDTFLECLARDEPFDAVITDLGMPYVDGRKVAAAVKRHSPTTPVLLLTGWGQQLVVEGDLPAQVDLVLGKPPRIRELREALVRLCPVALA
jgi:signal transduction histidine kinase/ActR/RegA family two-component response regulator